MAATAIDEPAAAAELLERFGAESARRGGPIWVKLRENPGGTIEAREVKGRQGLLGRRVGREWPAAGVIGTGRLRVLDPAHEPPAALIPGLAGGLTMACVLSRRGVTGWRMRLPDGTFHERVPEEGFMLDVLRRSLQLETAPPPASMVAVELAVWCSSFRDAAAGRGRRLRWTEVLRLHPALADRPFGDESAAVDHLTSLSSRWEWEALRGLAAAGLESDLLPDPRLAIWMDVGMFARWVLGAIPPLDHLLLLGLPHLDPDARRRLAHLARRLDDRSPVR